MGYGKLSQKGTGLHLRQFSRAFIFDDGSTRLAIVTVDCGMVGDGVRLKVSLIPNYLWLGIVAIATVKYRYL